VRFPKPAVDSLVSAFDAIKFADFAAP